MNAIEAECALQQLKIDQLINIDWYHRFFPGVGQLQKVAPERASRSAKEIKQFIDRSQRKV